MHRVALGDAEAFARLYDRHCAAAFHAAVRVVRDRSAAEDVCQEAFLSVWRAAATFEPARGSIRGWVLGIVRNRAIDAIRHRRVQPAGVADPASALQDRPAREQTEEQALCNERARVVRLTLDVLPEAQRRPIMLAYYGELTHVEIARALDTPLGTVKGRIRLGLETLYHHATAIPESPLRMY